MPILYSVVARGTTVLAKFTSCAGNFAEVTEQILSRIPPENSKLTYTQGRYVEIYTFHNFRNVKHSLCFHSVSV